MIGRSTRLRLLAFVLMASIGVTYVGAKYAGLARFVTNPTYTVQLQLDESGGIFQNAEVTYQGVQVGRVGDLRATKTGVTVELRIDKDEKSIPSDGLRAEVKNLSVVGELYVNLVAETTGAPFLRDGSVISSSQATIPVAPAELLASLNGLLTSVPTESLSTVLFELDRGFSGTGPELGRLLDTTGTFIAEANRSVTQTTALIRDGATVLRTQNDSADDIRSFSRDLRLLTSQLKKSDPDLRRLVTTAPQLSTQVISLLRESGAALGRLVADLLTLAHLAEPRDDALNQLLVTYPALVRAAYSAVPGTGKVNFGLVLNAFDPLPCTQGYEGTQRRPGTDIRDIPVNEEATCTLPQGNPSTVRGSQNAPHESVPERVPAPTE